ncbi:hypothetical protein GCM10007385_21000 [Tateyamaria omphalii]|nr:hypothetical protein GCM10007385_21000 [Tateyamaria omphalii]
MLQAERLLVDQPSGGSFLGKMKTGSLRKIHPAIRPGTAGRWGFTLHMAQLSSLPCILSMRR